MKMQKITSTSFHSGAGGQSHGVVHDDCWSWCMKLKMRYPLNCHICADIFQNQKKIWDILKMRAYKLNM